MVIDRSGPEIVGVSPRQLHHATGHDQSEASLKRAVRGEKSALGPGDNGFVTEAARIKFGVNVQGTTAGVYAEALADSPGTRQAPNGTGICGWGDKIGVIGQGRLALGLGDPDPQPIDDRPTGVCAPPNLPVAHCSWCGRCTRRLRRRASRLGRPR